MTNKSLEKSTEKINPRTVSFSTITEADKCGHFFVQKSIEKHYPKTDDLWTYFGKLIHRHLQSVLMNEELPKESAKKFIKIWYRFCRLYKKSLRIQVKNGDIKLPKGVLSPVELYKNPAKAILSICDSLKQTFGEYKVLWVECRLEENTDYPQKFSGYIDIGLELSNGNIIIADFKTCSSHFMFKKFQDKYKDYQITLYKHFYSQKNNIDPKKIETYFITICKDPSIKKEIEFIRVSSGPKKIKNALDWMNLTLEKIKAKSFQKNRMACHNWYGGTCPFFETKWCT